eukprot:1945576-Rhodomonas_salina.8
MQYAAFPVQIVRKRQTLAFDFAVKIPALALWRCRVLTRCTGLPARVVWSWSVPGSKSAVAYAMPGTDGGVLGYSMSKAAAASCYAEAGIGPESVQVRCPQL